MKYYTKDELNMMLLCAMEWGYKQHEKGYNIEMARLHFFEQIKEVTIGEEEETKRCIACGGIKIDETGYCGEHTELSEIQKWKD